MRHHNAMNHRPDRGGPGVGPDAERGRFGRRGQDPVMHGEGRGRFGRHGHGLRGAGRRGEDGEGRGRRRMFEGGELRLVMLLLMETEPRHGYDIIREIEARTGGAYAPSPGAVYPTLTLLEEMGQAETRASEGAKKLFAITPAGLAHLNANRADAEAALARLDALGREDEALDAGPVRRAIANFKAALRARLAGEPDKALLFSVADAIDEAARKIERL